MRRTLTTPLFWLVMVVVLLTGLALLGGASWMRPLMEAQQALDQGQLDAARMHYARAELRFNQIAASRQAFPALYRLSVDDQLYLMYRQGQLDALLEKAATSPATAGVHFWAGCAAYQKALAEEKIEAKLPWLGRAEDEFKKSLELDRHDWDTKYNYEVAKRLLTELKKQPKTPPKQQLQLLRPQPKPNGEPAKRVG